VRNSVARQGLEKTARALRADDVERQIAAHGAFIASRASARATRSAGKSGREHEIARIARRDLQVAGAYAFVKPGALGFHPVGATPARLEAPARFGNRNVEQDRQVGL